MNELEQRAYDAALNQIDELKEEIEELKDRIEDQEDVLGILREKYATLMKMFKMAVEMIDVEEFE